MSRQGLMDDSGYKGFEECSRYESCTNDFVAELLEPYDVESIDELVKNSYEKGRADAEKEYLLNTYGLTVKIADSEKQRIRTDAIDEVIKTLAKSENTILSDKQYYELLRMKEEVE